MCFCLNGDEKRESWYIITCDMSQLNSQAQLTLLAAQPASLLKEVGFPSATHSYPCISSLVLAQLLVELYSGPK